MNDDPRLQNLMIRKRFFNAIEEGNLALADRIRSVNGDLFTQKEEGELDMLILKKASAYPVI